MNIYVTNFDDSIGNADLLRLFCKFGSVRWLALIKRHGGCKRNGNYALLAMDDEVQACDAIEHLNGNRCCDAVITVSISCLQVVSPQPYMFINNLKYDH